MRWFCCWYWCSLVGSGCTWCTSFSVKESAQTSIISMILPFLLLWLIKEVTLLIRTNRTDLICLGPSSDKKIIVTTMFLNLRNPQGSLSLPRNLVLVTFGELKTVFSTNVNLLFLLVYWIMLTACPLHLVRQNFAWKSLLLKSLISYLKV